MISTKPKDDEPKDLKEGKELDQKRKCEPLETNLPVKRRKTKENCVSKNQNFSLTSTEESIESNIEEGKSSKTDNRKELCQKRKQQKNEENLMSKNQNFNLTSTESIIEEGKNSKNDNAETIFSGKEKNKFKPLVSSQWDEIESGKLLMYRTEGLLPRDKVFYCEYSSLTQKDKAFTL